MKILLDECVDRRLARDLVGHLVITVPRHGWAGIKNGDLLALAEKEFDAFITVDRKLSMQQDLTKFKIAVILIPQERIDSKTSVRSCLNYWKHSDALAQTR